MKRLFFLSLFNACLTSGICQSGLSHADSIIFNYVVNEFKIEQNKIPRIQEAIRDNVYKEVILYPGSYKLRVFDFKFIANWAFVIKVTDSKDSLIDLFSFTDEHYLLNSEKYFFIKADVAFIKAPIRLSQKNEFQFSRNLEDNFNNLIGKLGYYDNYFAAQQLIKVVFVSLLGMNEIDFGRWEFELEKIEKIKSKDKVLLKSISEYRNLKSVLTDCEQCKIFQARSGYFGYWIINQDFMSAKVKFSFVGEQLFSPYLRVD